MTNITLFRRICLNLYGFPLKYLFYHILAIYNSYKQLSKKACGQYLPSSSKTDLMTIATLRNFNCLFKGN